MKRHGTHRDDADDDDDDNNNNNYYYNYNSTDKKQDGGGEKQKQSEDQGQDPIVIVGAGIFGISTALALLRRRTTTTTETKKSSAFNGSGNSNSNPGSSAQPPPILLLDSAPVLPNPVGSSVDSSRIIRADYQDKVYSELAGEAQGHWREQRQEGQQDDDGGGGDGGWGGEGRYTKSGFVIVADAATTVDDGKMSGAEAGAGQRYVEQALRNSRSRMDHGGSGDDDDGDGTDKVQVLDDGEAIRELMGFSGTGPGSGGSGYVNWGGGWADASACVRFVLRRLKEWDVEDRVTIETGRKVRHLTFASAGGEEGEEDREKKPRCSGVELETGQVVAASLVVLATGAWTPTLVDLRGRAIATGQVLTYMDLTEAEQAAMAERPVFMNMSRGLFIIPPRNGELKIARHGFGYRNPKTVAKPSMAVSGQTGQTFDISIPDTATPVPAEGERACRDLLRDLFSDPAISERAFSRTRICWYCDTPDGNFLIDWHPACSNLFLATGGNGHGFKFFPLIGDRIVDAIEGRLAPELSDRWAWRPDPPPVFETTDDRSRAGRRGMILDEEIGRS